MWICVTSDTHGNRTIIDKLIAVVSQKCDLLLIYGDIGGKVGRSLADLGERQKKDADYLAAKLRELPVDARFILGNDDWFEYADEHYLSHPETIAGHTFVPFEWVPLTPFKTNRESNENKILYELGKLNADNQSIIVAHGPPFGCGDKHTEANALAVKPLTPGSSRFNRAPGFAAIYMKTLANTR
ncbi:hypothetical protein AGMMS49992_33440 [Clostridia bacterium]|nr:hypothetical protein AGMMS49992_33440 [Clostridia bacterium]